MSDSPTAQTEPLPAPPPHTLYSAELVVGAVGYQLVIRDHVRGTLESTQVSRKVVAKLPVYLAKLDLSPHH